jgi:TetR/AcrR family transcriptional regulator, cholesterol catabolism regulator
MKPSKDNARRDRILSCSAGLFRHRGYERTSVRDIAEAAGITSGSLFYHFASKEDLLVEVMLEGLQSVTTAVAAAWSREAPLAERIEEMLHCHLAGLLGPNLDAMTVLLFESRSLSPEALRRVYARSSSYEQLWAQAIAAASAQGLVDGDAVLVRQAVLGALNWTAQWYRPGGRLGVDALAARLFEFLFPRLARTANAPTILETEEMK